MDYLLLKLQSNSVKSSDSFLNFLRLTLRTLTAASKLGAVTLRDNESNIIMHIQFLSQLITFNRQFFRGPSAVGPYNRHHLSPQSSTPECNLDDGVGRHVSLRPPPITLVYNTASLIGVDPSMCISLYLIWPYYRNIMC